MWNGWKGQLLRTLYYETELLLSGGFSEVSRKERAKHAAEQLGKALGNWSQKDQKTYTKLHYEPYLLSVELEDQIRHAHFIRESDKAGKALATMVRTHSFHAITEITVLSPDHPRLLSIIAGACAAAGANIADAQIFTTSDGRALDTILINREFPIDEDEMRRAATIGKMIEDVLSGHKRLPEVIATRSKGKKKNKTFPVQPDVTISNALSNKFTVVEVECLDRIGLLAEITAVLSDLSLDIHSARITTFGEKVIDTFYVTDLVGQKITNENRQASIVTQLKGVMAEQGRRAARSNALRHHRPGRSALGARPEEGQGLTMGLVKKFMTVGGATLGSRVFGFARETLMAAALGTGPMADVFYAAFRFPNLFRRLFAEGAFNAAFVPLFAKEIEANGVDGAKRFSEEVFGVLFSVLMLITIVMELSMPLLVRWVIAPGFSDDPEKFSLTVRLAAVMFPYLMCMSLTAMLSGMLNSLHHFFAAAIAPVFLNVMMIGALFWALYNGADPALTAWYLSWSVLGAGLLQMAVVYAGVRHAGMSISFKFPRFTPNVKAASGVGRSGGSDRRHHADQPADRARRSRRAKRAPLPPCNMPTASTSCRLASSGSPSVSCSCPNSRARSNPGT